MLPTLLVSPLRFERQLVLPTAFSLRWSGDNHSVRLLIILTDRELIDIPPEIERNSKITRQKFQEHISMPPHFYATDEIFAYYFQSAILQRNFSTRY